MFLRIVDVYLIFKHCHQKPKPFGIEINKDLEAAIVTIHIYMAHFYPIWIECSGVMLSHSNKTKVVSNNVINTELVGSSLMA